MWNNASNINSVRGQRTNLINQNGQIQNGHNNLTENIHNKMNTTVSSDKAQASR